MCKCMDMVDGKVDFCTCLSNNIKCLQGTSRFKKLHARVGTKNVPTLRLGKYEYAGEVPSAACFNRSLLVSNLHRGIVPSLKFKQQAGTADHLCNHGIGRGLYPVQC